MMLIRGTGVLIMVSILVLSVVLILRIIIVLISVIVLVFIYVFIVVLKPLIVVVRFRCGWVVFHWIGRAKLLASVESIEKMMTIKVNVVELGGKSPDT
jgi:hypothetical protein